MIDLVYNDTIYNIQASPKKASRKILFGFFDHV